MLKSGTRKLLSVARSRKGSSKKYRNTVAKLHRTQRKQGLPAAGYIKSVYDANKKALKKG